MQIDDNSIDFTIQQKTLEKSGISKVIYNHRSAFSALESLENLFKLSSYQEKEIVPEYILLDLDMPLMDGFQFMSEFEKLDYPNKERIKIILLTASINKQDKEFPKKFKNFHSFINKPLTLEKLKDL